MRVFVCVCAHVCVSLYTCTHIYMCAHMCFFFLKMKDKIGIIFWSLQLGKTITY